jgi:fucose permease
MQAEARMPPLAGFLTMVLAIFAAGAEQGVIQGALSRMLDAMGRREAAGGMLVMAFSLGIILASFAAAVIIRRVGDRRVAVAGAVLAAAAWAAHALIRRYASGLPIFFVAGAGHGFILAGATALAAKTGGDAASQRISFMQAFYMLGLGAGALVGGYAEELNRASDNLFSAPHAWAVAFAVSSVFSLLCAVAIAATGSPEPESAPDPVQVAVLKQVVLLPGVALVIAIIFLDIGAEAGIGAWLSRYLQVHRDATPVAAGWAVSLFYAGMVAGRLLFGVWTPPLPRHRVLLIAAIFCAALTGAMVFTALPMTLPVATGAGFAVALVVPFGLATIRDRCPDALSGAATSAALGVACIGGLVFPPIIGAAAQWTGSFSGAMMVPAGLFVVIVGLAAGVGKGDDRRRTTDDG